MNDKKPVLYDEYGCPIEHQNATSDPDGISSGPTSSDHKNADGDHDKRGNTHKLQIAGLVVGCIACGAAVITAWIYYGQLREMIKATKATGEAIRISAGQSAIMERELADSEAQQRAVLKIERFTYRKATNGPIDWMRMTTQTVVDSRQPPMFVLEQEILIKNYGPTPAIDLFGEGQFIQSGLEEMDKRFGIPINQHRWNGGERIPNPKNGAGTILPQETLTNSGFMTTQILGDTLYVEQWYSYRDIFGHSYVVGEAGNYTPSNDVFTPVMLYRPHLQGRETNQQTKPN